MCVVMYMCAQKGSECAKVEWAQVASAARARHLTGHYGGSVPHFALLSVRNKAAYAALHGYTFLLAEELYATDVSDPPPCTPFSDYAASQFPILSPFHSEA